jgi:hypothetical protein
MLKDELQDIIQKANIHADRLKAALKKVKTFDLSQIDQFSMDQTAYTDMLTQRFASLQDTIGSRIFPRILKLNQEDALTFLDKLLRLEKIHYLPKGSDWWISLRELRNQTTHDDPLEREVTEANLHILLLRSEELLEYWDELRNKISVFLGR